MGAMGASWASLACLNTHTANSMPACFSRSVVLAPYTHAKITCSNILVDMMVSRLVLRQYANTTMIKYP